MRDYSFLQRLFLLALVAGTACTDGGKKTPGDADSTAANTPASFPCAHFEDLRAFLPESLEGLQRTQEGGSTGRYGEVSVSEVERSFTHGEDREVKVRIVDTSLGKKLGQAIRAAADEGRGRATNDPTAPIFWKDKEAVGFVRYDVSSGLAEASLLVGNRYVVAVSSRGYPGTVEVRRVAQDIDLEGLARLHRAPGGTDRQ
ncbi:hypothetical protein ATI61_103430 [Archangium gephyra]|uniref:Lipoprotein n=1 Tax=Archangium gephyra TaxID=48 RepID=A0AAC8Q6L2_9BACT|nr:hypothetical protein [Archangium gephyra]AKJ01719.1 Hypothetical protein AA314_03345 [Archangium gephyra]REG34530.1 hypothetical protein ATI61_103430 [Archangium gephyra]